VVLTVVLRLLPGPLEDGELVGEAEVIATGQVAYVRGAADIVGLMREAVTSIEAQSAPGVRRSNPDDPTRTTRWR
jgi:hypothetical protein